MDNNGVASERLAVDGAAWDRHDRPPMALILAAGRGSRLDGATMGRPKCLVEIGDRSLLDHQLDALGSAGITRAVIVTGYQGDMIIAAAGGRATIVQNEDWAQTNSLYSLSLCREAVEGSCMVLNSDVLFDAAMIRRLLESGGNTFAYDSSSGQDDEHMKVEFAGGRLVRMSKVLEAQRSHGENVGVLYFRGDTVEMLFESVVEALECCGPNVWMAAAVERLADRAALRGVDMADQHWVEIDYPHDLMLARRQVWPAMRALRNPRRRKPGRPISADLPGLGVAGI
jgi:choline kinase